MATESNVDTASGDTIEMGIVTPFTYSSTYTLTDALDVTSPPPATETVEAVSGESISGYLPTQVVITETTTAGHADTVGIGVAQYVGDYDPYHAVHDGANEPSLDTSQGLVSALGGQDANALEFVGAEIHPGANSTGTAMVIDEGQSGASPITPWVSHPSAIGYRRQGVISRGSGSGDGSLTIAAVAPEFDSGMNDGTDGQELERVANFYTGAEENPTSAQSAPTPRAQQQSTQQTAPAGPMRLSDGPPIVGPGGDPLFAPGMPTAANLGNSGNVGGYTGYQLVQENAWWLGPLGFLPPGFGVGGGSTGSGFGRQSVDGSPGPPIYNIPSRGGGGPSPGTTASSKWGPTNSDGVVASPAPDLPGEPTPAAAPTPGTPPAGAAGSEINPAQPAPQKNIDGFETVPGASDEPTAPLYEGYWWEVGKAAMGEGQSVSGMLTAIPSAIWNYDKTWQGLKYTARHPILTTQAVARTVAAKLDSGSAGQGEVLMDITLLLAGPSAAAKGFGKATQILQVARAARATRLAEALSAGATLEGADLAEGLLAVGESAAPVAEGAAAIGSAAEGAASLLVVPGRVLSRINLANKGWSHLVGRHFTGKSNASQFTVTQAELRGILQSRQVVGTPVTSTLQSADGIRYVRVVDLGRQIGLDKFNNFNPTSIMSVLSDNFGNLVTATPGIIK